MVYSYEKNANIRLKSKDIGKFSQKLQNITSEDTY